MSGDDLPGKGLSVTSVPGRLWLLAGRHWDTLVLFLGGLLLYGFTAAPSVATVFDDSLEFQVVLPTLGIAHPSGYPLYTLLGWLFTHLLPFRDPAGRANLLSALVAALAVGILYLVAKRLSGSRPAAAVAAIAFALSPAWWSQATIAEVYALHGLLMILFVYLLLRWEGNRRQPSADRWLVAAAFVFGLGMTHHRMIALLLPAALVFVLWTEPGLLRRPRRWLWPIAAAVVPLLLYAYLPIRGQAVNALDGTFVPTLAGTLDWIAARAYGVFLSENPFGVQRTPALFAALFVEQFGLLLILAGLLGLVMAWRCNVRRSVFLLLATLATVAFGVVYKVQDVDVFLIPAFMLTTLWIALGLVPVIDSALAYAASFGRSLHLPRGARPLVLGAALLLIAILVLAEPVRAAAVDFTKRDRSHAWSVYDYGQDMLDNAAPGGRVVGLLGETTLLRYFREVLGQRTDVTVVPADAEPARFAAVDQALAAGNAVYLTRDLPGASARYSLDAAGPLIAVSPKAKAAAAPAGQPVGAGVLLIDARTAVRRTHAGPVVRVTPTWVAAVSIKEDLKVSARLLDAAGKQLQQQDGIPVHFTYPTTAWTPGEPVRDSYDLPSPPDAPSGSYGILLILYRATDGGEVGRVQLPPVDIVR